jgi:hypothetical protein
VYTRGNRCSNLLPQSIAGIQLRQRLRQPAAATIEATSCGNDCPNQTCLILGSRCGFDCLVYSELAIVATIMQTKSFDFFILMA